MSRATSTVNVASIRVRVIDPRFQGKSVDQRDKLVDKYLKNLPDATQRDIMNLLTFSPDEIADEETGQLRAFSLNREFEHPSS